MSVVEEIRGVTWDLWGEELSHEQTVQRIVNAGFPVKGGAAFKMFGIVEGESGEWLKAWHINVVRFTDADGNSNIQRFDSNGIENKLGSFMKMKSIDLGLMQINTEISPDQLIEMTKEKVTEFVDNMFTLHPELSSGVESCAIAFDIWSKRGFSPWLAYKPGTDKWKIKMREACFGFANWAAHSYVGRTDPVTGKPLNMGFI